MSAMYKPITWFQYVDYSFLIWDHWPQKLRQFLEYINGLQDSIQFTMGLEVNENYIGTHVRIFKDKRGGGKIIFEHDKLNDKLHQLSALTANGYTVGYATKK